MSYHVCTRCGIHHVDNCPTCLGWGLRDKPTGCEQVPITADEAHGDKTLPPWRACPTCGGTPHGYDANAKHEGQS